MRDKYHSLHLIVHFLNTHISAHRSWLYRVLLSGGIDPDDPHNPIDNPEHGCMTWFRDYLAAALNCRPVKVIIIIVFVFYLLGALYGLTTLKEGLDRRKLSKEDSYSIVFYDREDFYFREFPYRIQVSYKKDTKIVNENFLIFFVIHNIFLISSVFRCISLLESADFIYFDIKKYYENEKNIAHFYLF